MADLVAATAAATVADTAIQRPRGRRPASSPSLNSDGGPIRREKIRAADRPSGILRPLRSGEDRLDHFPGHVGQAEVAAVVAVGQLLVVEAQQVQDRGVQVVDADAVDRRPCSRSRRSRRSARRPSRRRRPARSVKACGLWSRPVPPFCTIGSRPNSPPQITSVASSRPRCFEVGRAAPAIGWSVSPAKPRWLPAMSMWPSQLRSFSMPPRVDLHEAHAALDQPPGDQALPGEVRRTSGCRGRTASAMCSRLARRRRAPPARPSACGRPARSSRSAPPAPASPGAARRCRRLSRREQVELRAAAARRSCRPGACRLSIGVALRR